MYWKYRCVPTPRAPRVRPDTIPLTITIIVVPLPRCGGESDDISLPRSVMHMCLIIMLNLLLFPRFSFCLFLHEQHNSLQTFPNAHACPRPTSIGGCGDIRQPVSARTDHTGQGEARCRRFRARFLCPVRSPSPSMLLLALANSQTRRLAMNSRITNPRTTRSSERPLSSFNHHLCLLSCVTSLPGPSRAVSTWYPHKRDQPNDTAAAVKVSYVRTPAKNK